MGEIAQNFNYLNEQFFGLNRKSTTNTSGAMNLNSATHYIKFEDLSLVLCMCIFTGVSLGATGI